MAKKDYQPSSLLTEAIIQTSAAPHVDKRVCQSYKTLWYYKSAQDTVTVWLTWRPCTVYLALSVSTLQDWHLSSLLHQLQAHIMNCQFSIHEECTSFHYCQRSFWQCSKTHWSPSKAQQTSNSTEGSKLRSSKTKAYKTFDHDKGLQLSWYHVTLRHLISAAPPWKPDHSSPSHRAPIPCSTAEQHLSWSSDLSSTALHPHSPALCASAWSLSPCLRNEPLRVTMQTCCCWSRD